MAGSRCLFALAMVVAAHFAAAQPLFKREPDWTITVCGWQFGLQGIIQIPGDFHRTRIWLGPRYFEMHLRANVVMLLVLGPPAAAMFRFRAVLDGIRTWRAP